MQMKQKAWAVMLSAGLLASSMPTAALATPPTSGSEGQFTDITNAYGEAVLRDWVQQGLLAGYPDGTVRPQGVFSRAEYMAFVNRAFGFTQEADISQFKDVSPSDWFYHEVARAVAAGYVSGTAADRMQPNEPLTNAQLISLLERLAKDHGKDRSTEASFDALVAQYPRWAQKSAETLLKKSYLAPGIDFKNPDGVAQRASAVVLLDRVYKNKAVITQPGRYSLGTVSDLSVQAKDVVLNGGEITGTLSLSKDAKNLTINGTKLSQAAQDALKAGGSGSQKSSNSDVIPGTVPTNLGGHGRGGGSSHHTRPTKPVENNDTKPTPEVENEAKKPLLSLLEKAKAYLEEMHTNLPTTDTLRLAIDKAQKVADTTDGDYSAAEAALQKVLDAMQARKTGSLIYFPENAQFKDGTYFAYAAGFRSDSIRMAVTVKDNKVTDIRLDHYADDVHPYKAQTDAFVKALNKKNAENGGDIQKLIEYYRLMEAVRPHVGDTETLNYEADRDIPPEYNSGDRHKDRAKATELAKSLGIDAYTGATSSSSGASAAMARALLQSYIAKNGDAKSVMEMRFKDRRNNQVERVNPGEVIDLSPYVLRVYFVDGSTKDVTFDEMADYGIQTKVRYTYYADGEETHNDQAFEPGKTKPVNGMQTTIVYTHPATGSTLMMPLYEAYERVYADVQSFEYRLDDGPWTAFDSVRMGKGEDSGYAYWTQKIALPKESEGKTFTLRVKDKDGTVLPLTKDTHTIHWNEKGTDRFSTSGDDEALRTQTGKKGAEVRPGTLEINFSQSDGDKEEEEKAKIERIQTPPTIHYEEHIRSKNAKSGTEVATIEDPAGVTIDHYALVPMEGKPRNANYYAHNNLFEIRDKKIYITDLTKPELADNPYIDRSGDAPVLKPIGYCLTLEGVLQNGKHTPLVSSLSMNDESAIYDFSISDNRGSDARINNLYYFIGDTRPESLSGYQKMAIHPDFLERYGTRKYPANSLYLPFEASQVGKKLFVHIEGFDPETHLMFEGGQDKEYDLTSTSNSFKLGTEAGDENHTGNYTLVLDSDKAEKNRYWRAQARLGLKAGTPRLKATTAVGDASLKDGTVVGTYEVMSANDGDYTLRLEGTDKDRFTLDESNHTIKITGGDLTIRDGGRSDSYNVYLVAEDKHTGFLSNKLYLTDEGDIRIMRPDAIDEHVTLKPVSGLKAKDLVAGTVVATLEPQGSAHYDSYTLTDESDYGHKDDYLVQTMHNDLFAIEDNKIIVRKDLASADTQKIARALNKEESIEEPPSEFDPVDRSATPHLKAGGYAIRFAGVCDGVRTTGDSSYDVWDSGAMHLFFEAGASSPSEPPAVEEENKNETDPRIQTLFYYVGKTAPSSDSDYKEVPVSPDLLTEEDTYGGSRGTLWIPTPDAQSGDTVYIKVKTYSENTKLTASDEKTFSFPWPGDGMERALQTTLKNNDPSQNHGYDYTADYHVGTYLPTKASSHNNKAQTILVEHPDLSISDKVDPTSEKSKPGAVVWKFETKRTPGALNEAYSLSLAGTDKDYFEIGEDEGDGVHTIVVKKELVARSEAYKVRVVATDKATGGTRSIEAFNPGGQGLKVEVENVDAEVVFTPTPGLKAADLKAGTVVGTFSAKASTQPDYSFDSYALIDFIEGYGEAEDWLPWTMHNKLFAIEGDKLIVTRDLDSLPTADIPRAVTDTDEWYDTPQDKDPVDRSTGTPHLKAGGYAIMVQGVKGSKPSDAFKSREDATHELRLFFKD